MKIASLITSLIEIIWELNNSKFCEPNKDNGFSQNINETEYGALDDLDYFETLDKDIIPPYWIVAGCVLVAGVITIIAGKQEKYFLALRAFYNPDFL